jgi:DNA-binding IclR family transcriptional regulator
MTRFDDRAAASESGPELGSVLDRILCILDSVRESQGPLSITDLAVRSNMPKSTASRLAAELVEQRYLERSGSGVALGMRLFELGARAGLPGRLRTAAAPIIRTLWDQTGERIGLWMHRDGEMVSITTVSGRLPMLSTHAGMRSPALTTASGKAFLAFCGDSVVIDRISAPLVEDDAARFRLELNRVRESAIASDEGVAYPGIRAVASPVRPIGGTAIGAISIAGPYESMDLDRLGPLVRTASHELSLRLTAA